VTALYTHISLAMWLCMFSRSPDTIWWAANQLFSSVP